MMCSEREMELSDEHDVIIELSGAPAVGMRFVDWLSENDPTRVDPVIQDRCHTQPAPMRWAWPVSPAIWRRGI